MRKIWGKQPDWCKNIAIFVTIILVSVGVFLIMIYFQGDLDIFIFEKNELKLKNDEYRDHPLALSVIRRNYAILYFALFGAGMIFWARWAHQKQLSYNEQQLEFSREENRNDRFVKAVELLDSSDIQKKKAGIMMVGEYKEKISDKVALYMLRDLISENPEKEYIRCVEAATNWLLTHETQHLSQEVINLLKIDDQQELLKKIIDEHIRKNNIIEEKKFWLNIQKVNLQKINMNYLNLYRVNFYDAKLNNAKLQGAILDNSDLSMAELDNAELEHASLRGTILAETVLTEANLENANLQGADLDTVYLESANLKNANLQNANLEDANMQNANLREANMEGVNLKDADITNVNFSGAIGLTRENILSAHWVSGGTDDHQPPKLPNYLSGYLDDKESEIYKWWNNTSVIDLSSIDAAEDNEIEDEDFDE